MKKKTTLVLTLGALLAGCGDSNPKFKLKVELPETPIQNPVITEGSSCIVERLPNGASIDCEDGTKVEVVCKTKERGKSEEHRKDDDK